MSWHTENARYQMPQPMTDATVEALEEMLEKSPLTKQDRQTLDHVIKGIRQKIRIIDSLWLFVGDHSEKKESMTSDPQEMEGGLLVYPSGRAVYIEKCNANSYGAWGVYKSDGFCGNKAWLAGEFANGAYWVKPIEQAHSGGA